MRKRLVVSVVIGSILFLQAPAQANHLYARIRAPQSDTYVEISEECPVGRTLTFSSGGLRQTVKVPKVRVHVRANKERYRKFTTPALNQVARRTGLTATCNLVGDPNHLVHVERLPQTGVTTTQELVVGLALVSIGVLLLVFGRRPPASRRPQRRRPPVKVYAQ
jgi:LPXTG-motif cell wall-anchored protein